MQKNTLYRTAVTALLAAYLLAAPTISRWERQSRDFKERVYHAARFNPAKDDIVAENQIPQFYGELERAKFLFPSHRDEMERTSLESMAANGYDESYRESPFSESIATHRSRNSDSSQVQQLRDQARLIAGVQHAMRNWERDVAVPPCYIEEMASALGDIHTYVRRNSINGDRFMAGISQKLQQLLDEKGKLFPDWGYSTDPLKNTQEKLQAICLYNP